MGALGAVHVEKVLVAERASFLKDSVASLSFSLTWIVLDQGSNTAPLFESEEGLKT